MKDRFTQDEAEPWRRDGIVPDPSLVGGGGGGAMLGAEGGAPASWPLAVLF